MGQTILFEERHKKNKKNNMVKKNSIVKIALIILIIGLAIAAFGLSLTNFTLLNASDGTIDLGDKDIFTRGTVTARIAEIGEGTIFIDNNGIAQLDPDIDKVIISSNLDIEDGNFSLGGVCITSSASELNILSEISQGQLIVGKTSGASILPIGSSLEYLRVSTSGDYLEWNSIPSYGVSTEGGLSLTSGLCFAVVAGNNIVVSSNGVSLDTSLTGIESITMTTGGVSFSSNDTFIGRDGTSLRLISSGTPFNFPGIDGSNNHVLTTDGDGNLTFTPKGSGGGGDTYNLNATGDGSSINLNLTSGTGTDDSLVKLTAGSNITLTRNSAAEVTIASSGSGSGGGGTCYGVSTEGGLTLTDGLCFAVVAGNNIVVSSDGVSLDTSLTGIESITMTTGGVSFSSNDTFIGRDGTSLRLISSGTPFNFPGIDGSSDQVLTTDGDGNLTFTAKGSGGGGGGGGTCYGVSTEGGLSLTSWSLFCCYSRR